MLRIRRTRRLFVPTAAAVLIGALTVVVPAAPAAAAAAITVTPSTGLADAQAVAVSATGLPPNTPIAIVECLPGAQSAGECSIGPLATSTTDSSGAFSNATFYVSQLIGNGGTDCATVTCTIGVGTYDYTLLATYPITMVDTIGPADAVTLTGPFVVDAKGRATVGATVQCNHDGQTTADLSVNGRDSFLLFPCTKGQTVHAISDLITVNGGFTPGSATVRVEEGGLRLIVVTGTVSLQTQAQAQAQLAADLSGPNGTEVLAQFVTDLWFRLLHNYTFAREFFIAILRPPVTA